MLMTQAFWKEMEEGFRVSNGDYVVRWYGRTILSRLRWSFDKACERAGLIGRPTPLHLKYSFTSWLAMDKVPIDQVADCLVTSKYIEECLQEIWPVISA